jgi:uncharacterized protein YjbI with pentapeptide repeats
MEFLESTNPISYADLSRADLSGRNLYGADVSGAKVAGSAPSPIASSWVRIASTKASKSSYHSLGSVPTNTAPS